MRGQFSLRESGDKKPFKIDTDAYVDGQEFHNLLNRWYRQPRLEDYTKNTHYKESQFPTLPTHRG